MSRSESEAVHSAIDAVILLNKEAGTSNESLTTLLKVVSKDRGKAAFDKFCRDIMACIQGCFSHFSKVLPHLAKIRAHRDFHQVRMKSIPAIWQSFTASVGLQDMEPLNLQAVSRQLFDHCMKELFMMLKIPVVQKKPDVKLLADEENALRYASGYVGMKLLRQIKKLEGPKAAQFRECLSNMSRSGEESSFYAYSSEWIDAVNRGGLFVVSDHTFELFRSIEVKTRQVLPLHLAGSAQACSSKEDLVKLVVNDEMVQLNWRTVGVDIVDEEDANDLLTMIVGMWITMRGFALTSTWMEDYKRAKDKTLKKSKSLRKELKATDSED